MIDCGRVREGRAMRQKVTEAYCLGSIADRFRSQFRPCDCLRVELECSGAGTRRVEIVTNELDALQRGD